MKICAICKATKPLEEFNKNATKSDGLQIHCRPCNKVRARVYYAANRQKHKTACVAVKKRRVEENKVRLLAYLAKHPCVNCTESDPIVLDFDHVRGTKKHPVSTMVFEGCAWSSIEEEIAKCDVRCANCHRRKTAKELGLYRYRLRSSRVEQPPLKR